MTDKAVALEIQKIYPGHKPSAYSFAKNSDKTGVQFTPRAQAIRRLLGVAEETVTKRKAKRVKSVEFRGRLTPEDGESVKRKMVACGISSKQELVEALLLRWAKEKAPAAATAETNS